MLIAAALFTALSASPFLGHWTGTLTYADYQTGAAVALPTTLAVAAVGPDLRFDYVYDDGPGKIVRESDLVSIEPQRGTYRVRAGSDDDLYHSNDFPAVLARGRGTIVLAGSGTDNDAPVDVRERIVVAPTALVIRREVRPPGGAYFTRHTYRFTRNLARAALLADAAVLIHAYEALDPGLYRYLTTHQARQRAQHFRESLAGAKNLAQAWLAVTRYTASLRCGHCFANPVNQPDALGQAIFGGTNRLPFAFTWIGGHLIVTQNFSPDAALAPGSEVTAIGSYSAAEILRRLLPDMRGDGANDAQRIAALNVRGDRRYEPFDLVFPLEFPQPSRRFVVRVRTFGAPAEQTIRVAAQSAADRLARLPATAAEDGSAALWTARDLDSRTVVLTMPSWNTAGSSWDWKCFLNDMFRRLSARGTRDLIIDLRGNEGGADAVGTVLAGHLTAATLAPVPNDRLVRYRSIPPDLGPNLDTWDPGFKNWGAAVTRFDRRFFVLASPPTESLAGPITPLAPRFTGQVWVLVDGSNSSATFLFADRVRRAHLGLLAGTPTGGNQRGLDGSAFFFVRLPNTDIEVDLPLIGSFPRAAMPDAGIEPDIRIEATPADIATGRDAVLAAVRAHIAHRSAYHSNEP